MKACGRTYRAEETTGFVDAFLGIHGQTPGFEALVVSGSSVHGFGLRQPMWVFGLDERGDQIGGRLLGPNRVVRFPGASVVVEFPRGLACRLRHDRHTVRMAR